MELLVLFYTPEDGHTDPTSTTNAMAKGARNRGAKIYRKTELLTLNYLILVNGM